VAYRSGSPAATNISFGGVGTLECPVTQTNIANWEAVTLPSDFKVNNDRLNIEVWPPTVRGGASLGSAPTWNAAIGYASDMFRVGYFYYPQYRGY